MRGTRGRLIIQSKFYERKPYHYNSRSAHHATFSTVSKTIWDHTLSPWPRARLDAALLPPDADDATRWEDAPREE